jgi:hypothetical protein
LVLFKNPVIDSHIKCHSFPVIAGDKSSSGIVNGKSIKPAEDPRFIIIIGNDGLKRIMNATGKKVFFPGGNMVPVKTKIGKSILDIHSGIGETETIEKII